MARRFRETFPDADPVDMSEALNSLIEHGGEAKLVTKLNQYFPGQVPLDALNSALAELGYQRRDPDFEPVDISDVPDKPSDLDMWQDRTTGMVCGTCMNYLHKGVDFKGDPIGACKETSPTMKGYPRVYQSEPGCGAHKLRVDSP